MTKQLHLPHGAILLLAASQTEPVDWRWEPLAYPSWPGALLFGAGGCHTVAHSGV
jgi:hypothetical protein